jgi:hypothetical protein
LVGGDRLDKPTSIKIGALDYAIEWQDGNWMAASERFGECSFTQQVIRINGTMPAHRVATTFLHEVTHAVLAHFGVHDEKQDDEDIATMIGTGLTMVWRDNPDVLKWWSSLICG